MYIFNILPSDIKHYVEKNNKMCVAKINHVILSVTENGKSTKQENLLVLQ